MPDAADKTKKLSRWYFGGLGSAGAACCTHPLDLLKVHLQTQQEGKMTIGRMAVKIVRNDGVLGLWNGLSASLVRQMFNGATMATCRAVLMTIGQLAFYDQFKQVLLTTSFFSDNLTTHFTASLLAASVATTMTQPLDVMKTRMMNAKPGEFRGIAHCFMYTAKLGPMAFYKGYVPAFVRLAPQTILTFVFFEQLRMNFGYFKPEGTKE